MIRTTCIFLILCLSRLHAQHWTWAHLSDTISSNFSFSRLAKTETDGFYLSVSDFSLLYPFSPASSSLIKYDVNGVELWRKNFSGPITIEEVISDKHCVYLAGHFTGSAQFITSNLTSAGNADMFVAKFDPTGHFQWVKTFGSKGNDLAMGMISDPSGYLYLTGEFSDTITFGSQNLISTSKHSAFVIKMDPAGNVLASRKFSGDQPVATIRGNKLKIDSYLNLYMLGYFDGPMHADGVALNNNGQASSFFCKLDAKLDVQWANNVGSSMCMASAITIDANDDISTETECGASPGGGKVFTTRYNTSGQVIWGASLFPPHSTDDIYSQSCISYEKNTLIAGNNWNCANSSSCYQELFLASYDSMGNQSFLDHSRATGNDLSRIQVVQVAPSLFIVSGTLNGDLLLGKDLLHSPRPHVFTALYSIEKTSGIDIHDPASFSLFPNPTSGLITVSGHTTGIRLFDDLGNCLLRSHSNTIDLSGFPAGVYFVEVSSGDKRTMKKVVHY